MEQLLRKKSSKVGEGEKCALCKTKFRDAIVFTCKTCKEEGVIFQICQDCEKKSYRHDRSHIFKPALAPKKI